MPAALTSGFGAPSKASPSEENGAAPPSPSFVSKAAAPTANATGIERRSDARTASASPTCNPRMGTSAGPSVPSEPAGSGPSTRTARAPAATTSRTASGEDVPRGSRTAAPADAAVAVAVEETGEAAGRADHSRSGGRQRNDRSRHRDRRGHHPAQRLHAGDEDPKPREEQDVAGRAAASGVDRTGGESRGRSARAADAAVRRACRSSLPAGATTSDVERRRACRGGGERTVGERRERLDDADEGNAGSIVGVAVLVGIDGELEAGEKLVGAPIDGDSARGIGLPARDPDRHQDCIGSDAVEIVGAVRADDEAGHLGAVALGPAGRSRILPGTRVPARIEHVVPGIKAPRM